VVDLYLSFWNSGSEEVQETKIFKNLASGFAAVDRTKRGKGNGEQMTTSEHDEKKRGLSWVTSGHLSLGQGWKRVRST